MLTTDEKKVFMALIAEHSDYLTEYIHGPYGTTDILWPEVKQLLEHESEQNIKHVMITFPEFTFEQVKEILTSLEEQGFVRHERATRIGHLYRIKLFPDTLTAT